MTPTAIRAAIQAADEFTRRARAVLKQTEWVGGEHCPKYEMVRTGKASGSLRRGSLDLTRALAEMRKG